MKRLFPFFHLIILHLHINSQNTVICRISPTQANTVNIKWYSEKLIYPEGVNVYRRIGNSSDWIKLNPYPIKKGIYKINEGEYQKDKELYDYVQILDNAGQLTGFSLLAVLLKSFKSEAYANYMGIRHDDNTAVQENKYEYKVQEIIGKSETLIANSLPIEIKKYEAIEPPQNIETKIKHKKCLIRWEPEPHRYFAVNIYRYSSEDKNEIKINSAPLVISKTKNKDGLPQRDSFGENYPDLFYIDEKLKNKITYYYTFVALDFFGEESKRSQTIAVFIKDNEAPTAPENLRKTVNGKNVKLSWIKKEKEEDFTGFNVYRTNNNDSDYIKLNSALIPVSDSTYTDKALNFKQYFYTVSSVDKDGNEARAVPLYIDVFDNEAPHAPKNLRIQADTGILRLYWDANVEPDIRGYLIYRTINQNNENNYVLITPQAIVQNSFVDDLPYNAKNNFLYKIVAVDSTYNKSAYSAFAVSKMPDVTAPASPFIKQITQNEKSEAVIEWLPDSEPDLMGYSIYRKIIDDSSSVFEKQNTALLNRQAFRYIDRYTRSNKSYEYYLTAIDSSGNTSAPSNNFKFKAWATSTTRDGTINHFKGNYIERKKAVELSWNTSGWDLKFILYKRSHNEKALVPLTVPLSNNQHTDKNIKEDQTYYYQLRAYSNTGDIMYSPIVKINTAAEKSK